MRNSSSLIFVIILLFASCQKPKNEFQIELNTLETSFNQGELSKLKNFTEDEVMRNIWVEKGTFFKENITNKKKGLISFFKSKGVHSYDDITEIMFISLHRKLNQKEIRLDKQISSKIKYWSSIEECINNKRLKAIEYSNNYFIGDTINIYYPYDEINKNSLLL